MKQRLAILGSTGSIGVQTLDIARETPGRFEVRVLTANRNWERLARQAREFDADAAVIADKQHYAQLRDALAGTDTKVYAGEEAVAQVAAGGGTDVVVNALVGYAGLAPTVAAIEAGKKLALANKESLVVGGACVIPLARKRKAPVIPIDSEHSAIFQCLVGERAPVRRLIVTCSGGAFRDFRAEELANVTVEQALRHPQQDHARLAGKAHARDGRGAQRAYHGCIHRADDAHQRALDGGGPGDGNVFFIEFFSFFVGHRLAIRARNLEKTL